MSDFLAFDIGTSSLRSAVFAENGEKVPATFTQTKYRLDRPEPGAAELSPETLLAAFDAAIPAPKVIGASPVISVSSMWHGIIGVDRLSADPLTPAFTWEDARPQIVMEDLSALFPAAELYERTGCPMDRTFWPAKLLWLRLRHPELFTPRTLWMAPAEWLLYRLSREIGTSAGMTSATGLFDRHTGDWADDILERLQLNRESFLPVTDEPVDIAGLGRFVGMIGDGAAGNLGSGAAGGHRLAVNFGTSAAVRLCGEFPDPPLGNGLFHYRLDARRSVFGGTINNAGNLHAWLLRTLRLSQEEIEDALDDPEFSRPVPDLHAAPFLGGERTPFWSAHPSGQLQGLRFHHGPLHIYMAMMDAVYFRLAAIAGLIGNALEPAQRPVDIILSGGLTQSPGSVQRLATILGQPVHTLQEPEISLQGALFYGLQKTGRDSPLPILHQEVLPDSQTRPFFVAARQHHEACVISAQ